MLMQNDICWKCVYQFIGSVQHALWQWVRFSTLHLGKHRVRDLGLCHISLLIKGL